MSTRDQLVERCESRYRDTANAVVTASEWADYINDVYMDVMSAAGAWTPPAPFLEARATNSVTATGEITLPTDVWKVTCVYNDTDDLEMEPITGRVAYRQLYPDPAANPGTPVHYRRRANVIEVYPRPSATTSIIVDYFVTPPVLGASDEPAFAEQYHRLLISGALGYAYEDDGDSRMASTHHARYLDLLSQMKAELEGSDGGRYQELVDEGW